MRTCTRCYRVLSRDNYEYIVQDVHVFLCYECWFHIPARDMPSEIEKIAAKRARRLSTIPTLPSSCIEIVESSFSYVEPPRSPGFLQRLASYLERSL